MPRPRVRARSGRARCPRPAPPAACRPAPSRLQEFITAPGADQHCRRHGAQRDPADRGVRGVLRRRLRRRRGQANALVDALEGCRYVMLKLTMLVMWFAPIAVFAAVTSAVAKSGFEVIAGLRHVHGPSSTSESGGLWLLLFLAGSGGASASARWRSSLPCASRRCSPSPRPRARRPTRKPWRAACAGVGAMLNFAAGSGAAAQRRADTTTRPHYNDGTETS